ncbi:MAG TPA: tetratricopeptide repeat protein [Caulobacteraceae bacterium]
MSDFFNEVDENVRATDAQAILKKALPWILGATAVIVVGVGAFWGWRTFELNQANKASEAYDRGVRALGDGNTAGADAAFAETAKVGDRAYKTLALEQRAGLLVEQKHIPDAVKLLDQAQKDAPSPIMGDIAGLKAAWLVLDTASYADIEKRLTPLMAKDRPYRSYAREALAMAKLLNGKAKDARGDFELLSVDGDAGDDVHHRAQAAMSLIDSGQADQLRAIVKEAANQPTLTAPGPNPFQQPGGPGAPGPASQPAGAPR